jgi:hypothetical protein
MAKALPPVLTTPPIVMPADAHFYQVDALLAAANNMLVKAMSSTPVATKPGDVKAMIDSAANALKLIETIKTNQVGKVSRQEVATEIGRILNEVEKARRHDVELLVDAELKKLGLQRKVDGGVEPIAAAQAPGVAVDADEPDILDVVEDAPAVPAAEGVGIVEEKMRLFTDVLKTLQGAG